MMNSMFPLEINSKASSILKVCKQKGVTIITAESCTGGLIAGCLTEIPGSSSVIEGGFVTYSNQAKVSMLSVKLEQLDQYGAVSEEVARSMAEGALGSSKADIAIACTGVAGPGGATNTKPVGLVHLSCALRKHPTLYKRCNFSGGRSTIRLATVKAAFELIEAQLNII
tara:strand:+ start:1223 stop:1729 length:507 start_codon:yes stop_codon:yes gene_type:complete